jgi:hypothetical protein
METLDSQSRHAAEEPETVGRKSREVVETRSHQAIAQADFQQSIEHENVKQPKRHCAIEFSARYCALFWSPKKHRQITVSEFCPSLPIKR